MPIHRQKLRKKIILIFNTIFFMQIDRKKSLGAKGKWVAYTQLIPI